MGDHPDTPTTPTPSRLDRLAQHIKMLDPSNEIAVKEAALELSSAALSAARQVRVTFLDYAMAKEAYGRARAEAWTAAKVDAFERDGLRLTKEDLTARVDLAVTAWGSPPRDFATELIVAEAAYEGARAADRTIRAVIDVMRSVLASARELPRYGATT